VTNPAFTHEPVLLRESLELMGLFPNATVVDATVGGGGHAAAILERTAPSGRLVGLDRDAQALAAAAARLAGYGPRVALIHASFRDLPQVLAELGIARVDGVLLDLGVSSPQLDRAERGFRFAEASAGATPLDMRMDPDAPASAADLLARASVEELERWLREYGELPGARRLARAIVAARERAPLRTARDLLAVISTARVGGGRRHHPATLVFQALRIATNDEIGVLAEGLEAAIASLAPGRRVAVIAYHSIEDRLVKERFRDEQRGCVCPPHVPVCACGRRPRLRVLTRRPVRPGPEELRANPRARSARLRAAERLPEAA
jgi:16S rRNA (cytosine1402-N4)-methyltransferase